MTGTIEGERQMHNSNRLDGKVVIITGAAGEIGRATAAVFAERGARIVAVDRDAAALSSLRTSLPADAIMIEADVTDEAQVQAYVARTIAEAGHIDIFFNNAGIEGGIHPIPEYPTDLFRRVIEINVVAVFLGMKHVIPVMVEQGGGVIVNTSSTAGVTGAAGLSAYIASKHAVIGLTRTAAVEWASKNVRVNSINPGPVEGRMMTAITEGFAPGGGDAMAQTLAAGIPSGRYSTPEEIATVVAFLASEDSRHMHGALLIVDGGQTVV